MNELNDYIKGLEIGEKSQATIRLYRKDLGKFTAYFSIKSAGDLGRLTVSDFQNFYESQNLSPNSLNSLIRSLSAFFIWLGKDFSDNAFFKVKFGKSRFIKVGKHKKIVLTDEEAISLVKAAQNIQDKFMIMLMLSTGLRRDEVGKIKISDISGCVITINGKGDKQRKTYMDETLCTMLNIYMAQRKSKSEYLFYGRHGDKSATGQLSGVSVNNRVRECAKLANIDPDKASKITAHRLRGTLITNVIRDYGIKAAQTVAGHASMNTTMIYDETGDEITRNVLMDRGGKFKESVNE